MKKRVTAAILTALILLVSCFSFHSSFYAANLYQQKSSLESDLTRLRNDKKALANSLAEAKSRTNEQQRVVDLMYEEINVCQQEIDMLTALINEYYALAKEKERQIEEINARMEKNFELFSKRLVFAQESGDMSLIDFILGSSDISDILSRSEQVNDMLEYDRKLIESLVSDKKEVEDAKLEIEEALKKCDEQQKEYETKVAELNTKMEEADAYLKKLETEQAEHQNDYDVKAMEASIKEKELDSINSQIRAEEKRQAEAAAAAAAAAARQNSGGNGGSQTVNPVPSSGGPSDWKGIWPVSNAYKNAISQYFHSGHSGMDIHTYGVRNRVPALSVLGGTVVRCGSYSSWGNLVVVHHDNGYETYYAHLDTILVSMGQRVSQGQQVGLIGSTGQSTGAHLHICVVTPGGVRVNPLPYIT